MAKVNFSHMDVLSGIVIRSTVDSGIIDTIKYPDLENGFFTIEAKDIRGDNRIRIANNFIPLLSSSQINYKGQPILALFGSDIESVLLKAKEIDISYRLAETPPKSDPTISYGKESGNWDAAMATPDLKSISQNYDFSRLSSPSSYVTRITAGMIGGILHVIAPTQWMFHMRDAISDVTTLPKKKIVIHRMPFFAPHDEMLLNPSILAAMVALASLKANKPVEIQDSYPVYRPSIHVERKSYYLASGKPVAEEVQASVGQGAYQLFADEMCNQMFAGFYPSSELAAVKMHINFNASDQSPAHFYGDLGFSEALASTEIQANLLASIVSLSPEEWRKQYLVPSTRHDEFIKCRDYGKMQEALEQITKESDFKRKYSAYENQRTKIGKYSSFFPYARGIACSVGPGIAGFSRSCKTITPISVQIQLDPGDKVKVNTCFYANGNSAKIWKRIIMEKLGVKEQDITFPDDGEEMVDSGPSVLASNSGRMPFLISHTCDLIKEKRFVNPLPLCESSNVNTLDAESNALFTSSSWIAMALELSIDTITFVPQVTHLWIKVMVGRLFDERAFAGKIRHTAITTLRENGAVFANRQDTAIDVSVESISDGLSSSVTSSVRAMALSTFASALAQATGSNNFVLPATSEKIFQEITRRKA